MYIDVRGFVRMTRSETQGENWQMSFVGGLPVAKLIEEINVALQK